MEVEEEAEEAAEAMANGGNGQVEEGEAVVSQDDIDALMDG